MKTTQTTDLKAKIIDTARSQLLEEGYQNLSLRKIARSIGISATSIYLHFKNKDHLVHMLIEEAIKELNLRLEESVLATNNPIEQLQDLTWAYVNFALDHPRCYKTIFLVSSDEMARYPKEKFRRALKGYQTIRRILLAGKESGQIKNHMPGIAVYTFWAQLHVVMSVVISERLYTKIDKNEFIAEAIEHIIDGYQRE